MYYCYKVKILEKYILVLKNIFLNLFVNYFILFSDKASMLSRGIEIVSNISICIFFYVDGEV